ncbi:helix-turn-helix domain-containing protein [Streptomyces sp. NPDC051098]|uniref:helix-turn-helix domain-containing protein n=1 Tax=Streptomyces sp. NPDC051098 TaxID=3155411 RepID=UPI0034405EB9
MTLEVVGLSGAPESVYRLLVSLGEMSVNEVVGRVDLSRLAVVSALESLAEQGMISVTDGIPLLYRATPPDVVLVPQLKRHAEALDLARTEVTELVQAYQATLRMQDTSHLIEVITGAEALRQHLQHIQSAAQTEMLWFCKPQYVAMPAGSNTAEFEGLARGVRYRVLYERAYFDDDGAVTNIAKAVEAGESARSVPHLPLRLAVADRAIAICPLVPGGPQGSPGQPKAALIRDRSLLSALIALFERYWEDAVPLDLDGSGAITGQTDASGRTPLSPMDRQLLSLLVAGVTDKAIATQTGLSRRTVQRRINGMLQLAGATTRTQLAWQAARRSWL